MSESVHSLKAEINKSETFHLILDNMVVLSKYLCYFHYYLWEYPLSSADLKIILYTYLTAGRRQRCDRLLTKNIFHLETFFNTLNKFCPSFSLPHPLQGSKVFSEQLGKKKQAFYKSMLAFLLLHTKLQLATEKSVLI